MRISSSAKGQNARSKIVPQKIKKRLKRGEVQTKEAKSLEDPMQTLKVLSAVRVTLRTITSKCCKSMRLKCAIISRLNSSSSCTSSAFKTRWRKVSEI